MTTFRLLDTGPLTAARNMALDKIILEEIAAGAAPPTLRFLQFKPAAVLVGRHQDVSQEVRTDYCLDHGIQVNRRHTGGGAILFQESAIGWELFGMSGTEPFCGSYETMLHKICHAAAEGLSRLGIRATFRPRNDIEVDGRKISGTGGASASGGFMFQGTVLVENEVELFLKALRVPVEKLKKREIESLMDRICFLRDLVRPEPSPARIKEALVGAFQDFFHMRCVSGDLTDAEKRRLAEEQAFFESPSWIDACRRPQGEVEPIRSIVQTDAGTIRVHLWPAPGRKRVGRALIVGDFFAVPSRVIRDLEAALIGALLEPAVLRPTVLGFFASNPGEILGISPETVADAVSAAAERLVLAGADFSRLEVNEIFFLNLSPGELGRHRPRWLLLPYCSKNLACPYRSVPGCDECGECEIGECFALARSHGLDPVTVQSFEHLMSVLETKCAREDGMYVGSCCEAFYAKHQREMEAVNARGVLINLDSTTCYDLGKGSQAYRGHFDNKTSLNIELIDKTLRFLKII